MMMRDEDGEFGVHGMRPHEGWHAAHVNKEPIHRKPIFWFVVGIVVCLVPVVIRLVG